MAENKVWRSGIAAGFSGFSRITQPDPQLWLTGGGELGTRMRAFAWGQTPLGPLREWPQSLRTAVSICLGSAVPTMIAWGPELVLLYNDAYLPLLGSARQSRALGRPMRECFPENRDQLERLLYDVVEAGQTARTDRLFATVGDEAVEHQDSIYAHSPIRDESGLVGGVLTTCTVAPGRAELVAGILGHDLRSPLSALLTAAEAVRRSPDGKTRDAGAVIVASGIRMREMIGQVLDYTRFRVGGGVEVDRRTCNLADVVHRAVEEIESAGDVRFEVQTVGDCHGFWDPDRLWQVVSNLAANAAHHGEGNGRRKIRIEADDSAVVRISFSNAGTIHDEALPRLFDPFAKARSGTARSNRGGLGLGLFIARELVAGHGGEIAVTSARDEVCFQVSLPRGTAAQEQPASAW